MSCGCGSCLFLEYSPDSPDFTPDAQRALAARGYERINRHDLRVGREAAEGRALVTPESRPAPPTAPAPLPDAGEKPGDRCVTGGLHSYGSAVQGGPDEVCVVCWSDAPKPPATEATGEMSEAEFSAGLERLVGHAFALGSIPGFMDGANTPRGWAKQREVVEARTPLLAAFAALRSSREAERQRGDRAVADLAAVKEAMDGLDLKGAEDVWAEVTDAAMKAWDQPMPYNDSPLELIAKIIDERDEARDLAARREQERREQGVQLERLSDEYGKRMTERDEAREQRDRLLGQLPDGMKHCVIVFRQCPVGHGWLTATNWTDFPCPTCDLAAANARAEEAERTVEAFQAAAMLGPDSDGITPAMVELEITVLRSRPGHRARSRGFYCPECGMRQPLPAGACNCRQCGSLGLRGYAIVPRKTACGAADCAFVGWSDGVNDDLGDHHRKAHREDRIQLETMKRALEEMAAALRPFVEAYPVHPDPLTPRYLESVPRGSVTVEQVRAARRALGSNP